ncbi:hypothetical protein [Paenibacillus naphthalenovorans]|uniref:hypothetical protein n=1 Tax=Paenibacillus naphthalenovorans TaxID=162209 RepID=UPI000885B306|nr:hypothetical protein [Paenibacillus naphthalenovorans]SDJ60242.1 hypothetical protein SAMN05421868_1344 [Paenibacillus naphthalenovorans]
MEDLSKKTIYPLVDTVTIIAHKGMQRLIIKEEELKWNSDEEYEFLTLQEISFQLDQLGYDRTYIVWEESGLEGNIYMYGNYSPPTWMEHGKTRGYA